MFCCQHCSQLSTILNKWILLYPIQYCWQLWTTWAAKHCSILLNSGLSVFTCVANYNRLEQIAIFMCWQFVKKVAPKCQLPSIWLACFVLVANQALFKSCFQIIWTFEFCSWRFNTVSVHKNCNLFTSVAISRWILQYCVTILPATEYQIWL